MLAICMTLVVILAAFQNGAILISSSQDLTQLGISLFPKAMPFGVIEVSILPRFEIMRSGSRATMTAACRNLQARRRAGHSNYRLCNTRILASGATVR